MDYGYGADEDSSNSYKNSTNDSGGGFMLNGSQPNSGDGAAKSVSRETIRPVTIKQLLKAEPGPKEESFFIDGTEIGKVTFVAQVRSILTQTTNVTYTVEDGTGTIKVKSWIDSDRRDLDADPRTPSGIGENSYVRVFGQLKSMDRKRDILSSNIRVITDFNETNFHLLEATSVHLYFTKGPGSIPKQQESLSYNQY